MVKIKNITSKFTDFQKKKKIDLSGPSKDQLANVVKILASNKLYAPDLESGNGVDGETSSWLNNMLANGERKDANKFSAGSQVVGLVLTLVSFISPRSSLLHRNENGYKVSPLFAPVLDKGAEAQVEALLERIEEWYSFLLFYFLILTVLLLQGFQHI